MKNQMTALLLSAAIAAPLAAYAETPYVGLDVGRSEQKLSVEDAGSLTSKKTSAKVYAGSQVTQYWGAEGGYVNFGDTTLKGGGALLRSKPSAYYLALTGTIPVDPQFSLFAKVGVSAASTKIHGSDSTQVADGKVNETTAVFGLGASYKITKNWIVVAEYENFGKIIDEDGISLKMSTASLGVRYAF